MWICGHLPENLFKENFIFSDSKITPVPLGIYLFQFNHGSTKTTFEICSIGAVKKDIRLTLITIVNFEHIPKHYSGVFFVGSEQVMTAGVVGFPKQCYNVPKSVYW